MNLILQPMVSIKNTKRKHMIKTITWVLVIMQATKKINNEINVKMKKI